MRLRTAICVLVMSAASAYGQDPLATINNTRNQLRPATNAVDQRRNDTIDQASPEASAAQAPIATVEQPESTGMRVPSAVTSAGPVTWEKSNVSPKRTKTAKTAPQAITPVPEMGKSVQTGRGKRDPFVSIIRTETLDHSGCATGKKCLVVDQIDLKGVVRSANGMIAVVENLARKTYFLHEKDPVFNGEVVRIERDGIVFRERVVDRLGRQGTREVVKRLAKPAV
jgi:hypothetical protein